MTDTPDEAEVARLAVDLLMAGLDRDTGRYKVLLAAVDGPTAGAALALAARTAETVRAEGLNRERARLLFEETVSRLAKGTDHD